VASTRILDLPHLALKGGAPQSSPGQLARQLHAVVGTLATPESVLALAGWELRMTELSADVGGQDALLIPTSEGGFRVVVDPRLSARQYWWAPTNPQAALLTSVVAFRTAHEIGHTFFYDRGRPPRRRIPVTLEEEDFCDRFAAAMLVRDDRRPNATLIAEIAREYGGNIELAVLWASNCPGVTVDVLAKNGSQRFGRRRCRNALLSSAVAGKAKIRVAA
jgi:hypothetical protein